MRKRDVAIAEAVNKAALDLPDVQPGDIGVAHSKGIIGWLIRVGTRSHWNHSFVVVEVNGPDPKDIVVVQAEAHGVEYATLDKVAPGGSYAILPCPTGVNRSLVVAQAEAYVKDAYAFIMIASIAMNILIPFLHLYTMRANTLICSAVSALSLHAGGHIYKPWGDLYSVTPAQIATALSAPAV